MYLNLVDKIESQEIRIAVILLRNLEILQFNAHEISEAVKCKKTKSLKTFNIGVGLYKTASYFNHDCFPAVSRYVIVLIQHIVNRSSFYLLMNLAYTRQHIKGIFQY